MEGDLTFKYIVAGDESGRGYILVAHEVQHGFVVTISLIYVCCLMVLVLLRRKLQKQRRVSALVLD